MELWRILLRRLGLRPVSQRTFTLNTELLEELQALSLYERRPVDDLAEELVSIGLDQVDLEQQVRDAWLLLSPRQRQVARLVRMGYTNQKIGSRLAISPGTVKTHVRAIRRKFGLERKTDLQILLVEAGIERWEE